MALEAILTSVGLELQVCLSWQPRAYPTPSLCAS
jgi:hypothetical protein